MDRWCSKQEKSFPKEAIQNGMCECCGEDANTDHTVCHVVDIKVKKCTIIDEFILFYRQETLNVLSATKNFS